MVSPIEQCVAPLLPCLARKGRGVATGFVDLFSGGRRRVSNLACLVAATFGVAAAPLLATPTSPGVTLVPAITTVTGNGSQGLPGASPTLASTSQNLAPIGVTTDPAGNVYFADGQYNVVWKIDRATGIMTIIAGLPNQQGQTGDGGPALLAKFRGPEGLKFDNAGNLYVIDSGNATVRKIDTTGIITTFAGTPHTPGETGDGGLATSAKLFGPAYLALDSANNLYIADNITNTIRRVDAITHIITTVAGDPTSARAAGQTGDGGVATSALLHAPNGIAVDTAGNLYIADRGNNAIRRVDAISHVISTVVGDGTSARASGSTGDGGAATSAFLNFPWSVEVDYSGNLFIADYSNHVVREVRNDGLIHTIAGTIGTAGFTGDGGAATDAQLTNPANIAFDNLGNAFVVDPNIGTIRQINLHSTFPPTAVGSASPSQNLVLHVVGTVFIAGITVPASQGGLTEYVTGSISGTGCSVGADIVGGSFGVNCLLPATFHPAYPGLRSVPLQVAALIVSAPTPLQFGMTGIGLGPQIGFSPALIATVAGNGTRGNTGDGGPATGAQMKNPLAAIVDFGGNMFIADYGNNRIRRVDAATGVITTFAGNGTLASDGDGLPATSAGLRSPTALALDAAGNLLITQNDGHVREVSVDTGAISTVAGGNGTGYTGDGGLATSAQIGVPNGIGLDLGGNIYIPDSRNNVIRKVDAITRIINTIAGTSIPGYSGDGGSALVAKLNNPLELTLDPANNLYFSDTVNNVVRRIDARTGIIATVAGNGTQGYSGDGGPATSAEFFSPAGVAVDGAGNLYIADGNNNAFRKVIAGTGIITTMAGNINFGYSGDGGAATVAFLDTPASAFFDGGGNLYFADEFNHAIRKISGVAPLAFGSVNVAASSTAQDVEARNTGNATLTLTSLTPSANFNLTGPNTTCENGTNLAGGANCVIGVIFAPATVGSMSGAVSIVANVAAPQVPLSGTGAAGPTTTTLAAVPNPSTLGQSVAFTATVAPAPIGSPLGTVTFSKGEVLLGTEPVNSSGIATFSTSSLPLGAASITATYSGNAGFIASTSAVVIETVHPPPAATVTTLALAPKPATAGQSVTLTATVAPAPTGSPLGTVSFFLNGETLAGTVSLNSAGVAVLSTAALPTGADSLTAVYSGNTGFATSTSTATVETVVAGGTTPTTTTLSASPNPAPAGQVVTLTATIAPAPTGSTLGTVSFFRGATLLGTEALNSSGVATFTVATLPDGADAITAVYSGNTAFGTSSSSVTTETVTAAFTVSAPLAPVSAAEGTSVAIGVTVPPLGGAFNGVVTLSASGLPAGATATFTPPAVTPGAAGAPTVLTIKLLSAPIASLPADQRQKIPFVPLSAATALACLAFGYHGCSRRTIKRALLSASLFLVGAALSACNAGFASKPGTLPGNYTIVITGTSGVLQRSTTITLVVP